MRRLSPMDRILCGLDSALRTLTVPEQRISLRPNPASFLPQEEPANQYTPTEKTVISGLMRVNHAGEVCAQALYQGQALTARTDEVKAQMAKAALEEIDHLAWCEERLAEFKSKPSILNPLWYLTALMIGIGAGIAGDKWSLGFLAETEKQVAAHLQKHLESLPLKDQKTRAILEQMHKDESEHAELARDAGALELPFFLQKLMQSTAKLMTVTSYYI